MNYRQEIILNIIEADGQIRIKDIQDLFPDISLMTVHRDLDELCETGKIVKFRGGARSVKFSTESVLEIREGQNKEGKKLIVEKALKFISPGSSVFIDAGSTNMMLARALPDVNITVFTTAPNIAIELCRLKNPSVNLCCGNLDKSNLSVSGMNTMDMINSINIDIAFIGVSGFTIENGLTCGHEGDMYLKKLVIKKARTSLALCDSTKLSRLMPFTFAMPDELDYVITDGHFPAAIYRAAEEKGTRLI